MERQTLLTIYVSSYHFAVGPKRYKSAELIRKWMRFYNHKLSYIFGQMVYLPFSHTDEEFVEFFQPSSSDLT